MADRWAVANGNWSNTATWNGGTLPTSADDVYADGKTVTIDQNVTVLSLRTTARSGGTAGGGFTTAGAYNVTATGEGIVAGSTICLTYTRDVTVSITGNIVGGTSSSQYGVYATGNLAQLSITGTVGKATGIASGSYSIYATGASANVSITGNLYASSGNDSSAIRMSGGSAQLTVIGNIFGGTGATSHGVYLFGSSPSITVTGNITGGGGGNSYGVYLTGGLITATGVFTAVTPLGNAIKSDATSSGYGVLASGDFIDAPNGTTAIHSRFLRIISSGTSGTTKYANNVGFPNGTLVSRVSPDLTTGMPSAANVRKNTAYGYNSELTGTLAVPPASSVALGVPVDNTAGTAVLSPADIAALVGAQIAASLSSIPPN